CGWACHRLEQPPPEICGGLNCPASGGLALNEWLGLIVVVVRGESHGSADPCGCACQSGEGAWGRARWTECGLHRPAVAIPALGQRHACAATIGMAPDGS